MGPQLVSHKIPTIDTLNESSGIWIHPTSAIRRTTNTTHDSASENVVGQGTAVGESVGDYGEENYKTDFEIAHENSKLQSERKIIELSPPPLDTTSVGTKSIRPPLNLTSVGAIATNAKTPVTGYSARKEKPQK